MKRFVAIAVAFLLLPVLVLAQGAQGRVKGVVTDSKGNPIAKATVTITCPEMSTYKKELVTDSKGGFATLIVDATKKYEFTVKAAGFVEQKKLEKPLIGAQTLEIDFQLKSDEEAQQENIKQIMEQPGIKEYREGRELIEAGNKAAAREKFAAAVELKGDLHLAWLELALLDSEAGRHAEALAEAEKCLALQPAFPACLAEAANAAKAKGDQATFEKYMAAYKQANPSDPSVPFNEAVVFLNKGDDAGARPLLEQALAADGDYPDALFQLGMVHVRAGESAKAKELFQRFLEVAPDHKEAPTAQEMMKYL